ncbi:MAG: DUF4012 domain-containing protein [Candidatus Uhrbacteria bacterium]
MEAKRKTKSNKKLTTKKPSILRFRAPKISKTFDEGVPVSLLNFSHLKTNKPSIKLNEATELSPFIVSFAQKKLETVEELPLVQLNFAVQENELKSLIETKEDFVSHHDLEQQLLENELTPSGFKTPAPAIAPLLPSFGAIHLALKNFKNKTEISEPLTENFDLSTIAPLPEKSLVLPFDLPEMEDGSNEESEVLTWDEVVRSNSETPKQTMARPKIAWSKRLAGLLAPIKKAFSRLQNFSIPIHIGSFEMPTGWHRALAAFVLVSFAFVLPLHAMETINDLRGAKNSLSQTGTTAVSKLNQAVSLMTTNSASAAASFEAARKDFSAAKSTVESFNSTTSLLLSILPSTGSTYKSGTNLISAGEELSEAGEKISQGLLAIQTDGLDTTGKLAILAESFKSAWPLLEKANDHLEKVDPTVLPVEYQANFSELQNLLPSFLASIQNVTKFSDTLATLLGAEGKKRYLLLFQNNTEIRPTGGFLGSFAVLDVSHGDITNLDVPEGGSYDLQGSLKESIVAPLPLQLLSARWEFQDSNWFPDFPTSARQALDFYNSAGGPTIDGVVAVNATFITSLLSLLGPVEMDEYDRTIDSENFLFETQKIVEYDYAAYQDPNSEREEAAPKAFIGDLTEKLLARVKDLDTASLLQILDTAQKGLSQKDIQLYFPNEDIQKVAREFSWTGEVKQTDHDYLMIVDANLGGGKTDLVIDEKVNLEVSVQADGKILNQLTITRTHNGINGAMFTGVNNVDFLRVYVPQGSKLISASGFTIPDISLFEEPDTDWTQDSDVLFNEENAMVDPATSTIISEEAGKTVFGNWVQTKPGETSTITFTYELPFEISTDVGLLQTVKNKVGLNNGETYSLLVQKQSGILNRQTNVTISAPDFKTLWSSDNKNITTFDNSSDSFTSILFSK